MKKEEGKKKEENSYTENIVLQLCRYKKCRTNEMQREGQQYIRSSKLNISHYKSSDTARQTACSKCFEGILGFTAKT